MGTHRPKKRVSSGLAKKTAKHTPHHNVTQRTPRADRWEPVEGPLYGLLDAADRIELERRRAKFARAA